MHKGGYRVTLNQGISSLSNPAVAAPARAAQRRATGSAPQRYWLSVSTAHSLHHPLLPDARAAGWVGGSPRHRGPRRAALAPRPRGAPTSYSGYIHYTGGATIVEPSALQRTGTRHTKHACHAFRFVRGRAPPPPVTLRSVLRMAAAPRGRSRCHLLQSLAAALPAAGMTAGGLTSASCR